MKWISSDTVCNNKIFIYKKSTKSYLHWIGSESKYRHQLRGYLAGLNYLPGSNENEDVLKCLHQCAESLQVPAITNVMSAGMEMVVDSKGSMVKVDGKNANDVASMVNMILTLNLLQHCSKFN